MILLINPVLRWAGGKRRILPQISQYLPNASDYECYVEPFIGGGAVLFHLQPAKALVNDVNPELVNLYQTIRDNVEALIDDLRTHKHDADYFYDLRAIDRSADYDQLSAVKKASRMLYLNRTCFNGLYRVNSKGYFNVPFGRYKNPNIVREDLLRWVSRYLQENDVQFHCQDFEPFLNQIDTGAFVYLDPPYHPISESSSFTNYAKEGFSAYDQIRLRKSCDDLVDRGCYLLLSNSDTGFIRNLYKDNRYEIIEIMAIRTISAKSFSKTRVNELLIMSKNGGCREIKKSEHP